MPGYYGTQGNWAETSPDHAASRNLLEGAFGGGAINQYPGTLGNMLQRG